MEEEEIKCFGKRLVAQEKNKEGAILLAKGCSKKEEAALFRGTSLKLAKINCTKYTKTKPMKQDTRNYIIIIAGEEDRREQKESEVKQKNYDSLGRRGATRSPNTKVLLKSFKLRFTI